MEGWQRRRRRRRGICRGRNMDLKDLAFTSRPGIGTSFRYTDSAEYDNYYNAELEELAQNYGDLVEFWLDGAGSGGHVYNFKKIIETLRTYQPDTIVFADTGLFEYGDARWVGNEAGVVDYENWNVIDRHGYRRWRPIEADTPLRNLHWFWHPNDEASLKSLAALLDTYDKTVGRRCLS